MGGAVGLHGVESVPKIRGLAGHLLFEGHISLEGHIRFQGADNVLFLFRPLNWMFDVYLDVLTTVLANV